MSQGRQRIISKRELADMAREFTMQQIADLYGMAYMTVAQCCGRDGVSCIDARKIDDLDIDSAWLCAARKRLGISHRELAGYLGISERRLESWMYERAVPKTYARIIYLAMGSVEARVYARNYNRARLNQRQCDA